jgi:hypothetical protein
MMIKFLLTSLLIFSLNTSALELNNDECRKIIDDLIQTLGEKSDHFKNDDKSIYGIHNFLDEAFNKVGDVGMDLYIKAKKNNTPVSADSVGILAQTTQSLAGGFTVLSRKYRSMRIDLLDFKENCFN